MAILSNFQANGQEAIKVAPPTQSGTLTYTGSAQSPSWTEYPASVITITSTPQTNAGTYNAVATLTSGHVWADTLKGGQRNIPWTIDKADGGSATVSTTSVSIAPGSSQNVTVTRIGDGVITAESSDTSICTVAVNDTTVTITGGDTDGDAVVTIHVAAGTNYQAMNDVMVSVSNLAFATINITTTTEEFFNQTITITSSALPAPVTRQFDVTGHAVYKTSVSGTYTFSVTYDGKTYTKEIAATTQSETYNVKLNKAWVLTVKINTANSNPATWATYDDDAVGMTAGSADWDEYFGHYPCVLNNGVELGKIKTSDYTKYEDGTSIPTALGNDVMIACPRRGIKVKYSGNILIVSMTDEDNVDGYSYKAHTYKGDYSDVFYIGAYKGNINNSQMYSSRDKSVLVSATADSLRTYARARGTGYENEAYYQLSFLIAMYMLKYKGQNPQITIGKGYTYNSNYKDYHNTGTTDTRGMDWGESSGKSAMKLFGIEDFYGNLYQFIDGIVSKNRTYYVSDGNYNSQGTGYTNTGQSSNRTSGFPIKVGDGDAAFAPTDQSGSASTSTYFCDVTGVDTGANNCLVYGGMSNDKEYAGLFCFYMQFPGSNSFPAISCRLMYMHVAS